MKFLTDKAIKYSKTVLVMILVVTGLFMYAIKKNTRMETDLDKYMPQEHPAFVYSDKAEEWFNIKDGIIFAVENKDGIYNSGTLKKIKDITKDLQKMEEIQKDDVTSLYTAENIIGTEMGLEVKSFYDKIPESEEKLEKINENVKNNEMVQGRILAGNEQVTLIIAEIGDDVFSQEFYHRLLELADSYEGPENLYVAGRPVVEGTMAYLGPRDMKRMVPIVIGVIILVLWLTLRSVKGTVFTLLVVLFSTIWAFGLMAVFKVPIYAVSTMIPVMLIAIGVADGIHLYSHLHLYMNNNPGIEKIKAIKEMCSTMGAPVIMTSVTTAVGFISLLTSQVYPVKYFGLFTAFGVMMAMVFSLSLIPAGLKVFGLPGWKKRQKEKDTEEKGIFFNSTEYILKNRKKIIIAALLIIGGSIYGITRMWIDSSFLSKFEDDSRIVRSDRFINKHFGGTSKLNVVLQAQDKNKFKDPEVLDRVLALQNDVQEEIELVGNSFGITDYLKRMNKVMHADKEEYNKIPGSHNLVAQYLLLYEMSGDPDNLWQVVDYDYKKLNLTFQLKSDNSRILNKAIAAVEEHEATLKKDGIDINYAGSGYKALVFTDLILKGQISSLIISLVVVVLLLSYMFKNFRAGLIGAVPITITAFISFGVMGLLNIPLSTTTALLSSIAIGIGIDYAVHFLEKYKIYLNETNDKLLSAKKTMVHSGKAITFNAIVVIAGFLVLLASVFPPNRQLGALVSLNMFTSFLGTLTVMMVLLYTADVFLEDKKKVNKEKKEEKNEKF
ncbi:MAG: efflux RND transporter permease subunit [Elusimicrobiota bacterium]